ncbi:hypothetical protein IV417_00030 [Alphaproteobacteria bacterium KMM 3653]|uniref:Uncharacterized protein n=1 Tax=Harenicola maris TaxID=2841044 RepID=A0AAP2CLA0_9RHOB|nr:hypothetical protein [Harenicola maris]
MGDPDSLKALGQLQSESLEALRQFNGVLWKEVFGEFHAHYGEMPI